MGTTTFEAMRATQITQIESINATGFAPRPVLFRVHRAEQDFRAWAEANPSACFRRFSVRDLGEYEPPTVSNTDVEEVIGLQEIVVAYPDDYRYGADASRDQYDVMRADFHLLDAEVGHRGTGNYTDGHAVYSALAYEPGEGVTFLAIDYQFRFYREQATLR